MCVSARVMQISLCTHLTVRGYIRSYCENFETEKPVFTHADFTWKLHTRYPGETSDHLRDIYHTVDPTRPLDVDSKSTIYTSLQKANQKAF